MNAVMSDKKWQAECDARTLIEANEIRKDPKRHAAAVAHAKEQLENVAKVIGDQPTGAKSK